MNQFLNTFREKLDTFWDKEEIDKMKILGEILAYANSNPNVFKHEFHEVKYDRQIMLFPIVLEALSVDTENWGQFYVELLEDILITAKQSEKPGDILWYLGDFTYIQNDNKPFVQKIVDRLYRELDAENINIKLASISTLPNYLENESIRNKSIIIDKLQQQLYDQNWKVRVAAFQSLGFEDLLPNGFKLTFKDQLRKLIFRST